MSPAGWGLIIPLLMFQQLRTTKGEARVKKPLHIEIFHLIDNALWGEIDGSYLQGVFPCSFPDRHNSTVCELINSDSKTNQYERIQQKLKKREEDREPDREYLTVSLYNIHTWSSLSKWPHKPDPCTLPTNLTMAESEESSIRFAKLFQGSFKFFDGSSTTSPFSSVQRTYFSGLNSSQLLPAKPFETLIKGASFVASTCHRGGGSTKRVSVVKELQKHLRVDSLGKCYHSPTGPEGITLEPGSNPLEALQLKQNAITNYMFYFAFENTYERGYITEKVFDALIAGVVPVYLVHNLPFSILH